MTSKLSAWWLERYYNEKSVCKLKMHQLLHEKISTQLHFPSTSARIKRSAEAGAF